MSTNNISTITGATTNIDMGGGGGSSFGMMGRHKK
jgi:hypothetical protein